MKAETLDPPTLPLNKNRPAASEDIELGNDPVAKGDPGIEVSEPEVGAMLKAEMLLEIALVT
jgi:hypothetical protein